MGLIADEIPRTECNLMTNRYGSRTDGNRYKVAVTARHLEIRDEFVGMN